jgi:cobalt-zinc-cadmium resistance protein CzcA
MQLLNVNEAMLPLMKPLEKLSGSPVQPAGQHPLIQLQQQNISIANAGVAVTKNENMPEFSGRFFTQRLYGLSDPFSGFSVTVAFPLFGSGAYRNKLKTVQAEAALQQKQYEYSVQVLNTRLAQAQQEVDKNKRLLSFYETAGLKQADEIIKASSLAYRAGEISFAELSQYLAQAIDIQRNYLENLNTYNQSVIQYYYFINQ